MPKNDFFNIAELSERVAGNIHANVKKVQELGQEITITQWTLIEQVRIQLAIAQQLSVISGVLKEQCAVSLAVGESLAKLLEHIGAAIKPLENKTGENKHGE